MRTRSNIAVFLKDGLTEVLNEKKIPLSYRLWAFGSGFFPCRAWLQGINRENKKDYLRDVDYYKNAPYNDVRYVAQISKQNFKNTLADFNDYLPHYYMKIADGNYQKLQDWPEDLEYEKSDSILPLLKKKKSLAMKRIVGRAGAGFIVAKALDDGNFTFNDLVCDYDKAKEYVLALDGYLITEFIEQADTYKNIWDKTTHTLRVQTYKKDAKSPAEIVFAYVRVGSSKALRAVGHVAAEGIYSTNLDLITGEPTATITPDEKGLVTYVEEHSETGKTVNVAVPNWDIISKKCVEMHNYLENLTWLGWDIVATNEGFKVLEINTFSGLVATEVFEPIKASERYSRIFDEMMKGKK